ncbi:MAG: FHA domain-containing protein [Prevotella sp.]|nr:FHA domain-containing protein [Prevotella sp.]
MEIIVGRKQDTSQLKVSIGNKEKAYGSLGSVPKSVSRQHFSLTQESEPGIFILRNLNPANETKVNGVNVEQKRVTTGDDITMGVDNYPFDWDAIAEVAPRIYDISYLKEVWDSYHQQKMKIQIQQGRFNAIRSLSGLLSMGSMAAAFFESNKDEGGISIRLVLYIGAAVFTAVLFIISYLNASKIPQKQDKIDKDFRARYVCPNDKCHHFMGGQPYDVLSQTSQCPYCKARFKTQS